MGGKAAIYAMAHSPDLVDITSQVCLICTINTPYKALDDYNFVIQLPVEVGYPIPGMFPTSTITDIEHACRMLCRVRLHTDQGVCSDLAHTDISNEVKIVTTARRVPIYAFVSGEPEPNSDVCDCVLKRLYYLEQLIPDAFPDDRDDGIVPITAQSASGVTEVVEYGTFCHGEYASNPNVALLLAIRISAILKNVLLQLRT